MNEIFKQLAAYNVWADERLTGCILSLTEEQQYLKLPSSFPSLFGTLTHMYFVNLVWWMRIKQEPGIPAVNSPYDGPIETLVAALIEKDKLWESWLQNATDNELAQDFHYKNTKGEAFSQSVSQALVQFFNHATYHRGQLVTLLHQLGVKQIPATDFIVWSRNSF